MDCLIGQMRYYINHHGFVTVEQVCILTNDIYTNDDIGMGWTHVSEFKTDQYGVTYLPLPIKLTPEKERHGMLILMQAEDTHVINYDNHTLQRYSVYGPWSSIKPAEYVELLDAVDNLNRVLNKIKGDTL